MYFFAAKKNEKLLFVKIKNKKSPPQYFTSVFHATFELYATSFSTH